MGYISVLFLLTYLLTSTVTEIDFMVTVDENVTGLAS